MLSRFALDTIICYITNMAANHPFLSTIRKMKTTGKNYPNPSGRNPNFPNKKISSYHYEVLTTLMAVITVCLMPIPILITLWLISINF